MDVPRTWVTFRPIVAETDELAWEKAHATMGVVDQSEPFGGFLEAGAQPCHRLGRQLSVGQPAADLLKVVSDEVISISLSLLARGHWLTRVLLDVGEHDRLDLGSDLGMLE